MDEIGYGLLNREMIRRVTELWHQGGAAILYLHLQSGSGAVDAALQEWEGEQAQLIWKQRLDNEYFYLLMRRRGDSRLEMLTAAAADGLGRILNKVFEKHAIPSSPDVEDAPVGFRVGVSAALPSGSGRSTESALYQAIKEAILSAEHSIWHHPATVAELAAASTADALSDTQGNSMALRIGELASPIPTFFYLAKVSELAYMFNTNPKAHGAVIVNEEGLPVGLLMKEKLHQLLAGQFGLPLYYNRSVERIMNNHPLIVDADLPVETVSQLAMARDFSQLYDVVIITREDRMIGAASIRSILECMTTLRTEAARTANPLTGLPGNEGIQLELERRIRMKTPFSVIYADLDYFKWYNDFFGFSLGDDLIRYLSHTLCGITKELGTSRDFIGHIGGDDFIVLTECPLPEMLCQRMIESFDEGVKRFHQGMEVTCVEDRHGNLVKQEGVTLSLSLMVWDGTAPLSSEEVSRTSARLKKQAKLRRGSVYVVEHIGYLHHGEERTSS
ncbi:GGDEF domain-containing protein [Paenibacillus sp. GCM10023252]|uniref:GGDEF domain-containing protein n=1 Tax=Paenibacillus sp. GCM10023252 TaxID=3252649 RepID=UPI00360CD11C